MILNTLTEMASVGIPLRLTFHEVAHIGNFNRSRCPRDTQEELWAAAAVLLLLLLE